MKSRFLHWLFFTLRRYTRRYTIKNLNQPASAYTLTRRFVVTASSLYYIRSAHECEHVTVGDWLFFFRHSVWDREVKFSVMLGNRNILKEG